MLSNGGEDGRCTLPLCQVNPGHLAVGSRVKQPPLDLVNQRYVLGDEVVIKVGALVGEDAFILESFLLGCLLKQVCQIM